MKSAYLRLISLVLSIIAMGAALTWMSHKTFRASMAGSTIPFQAIAQFNAMDLLAVLIGLAIAAVVVSAIIAVGAALFAIRDILEEIRK